jgi:hypothetical protein
MPAGPTSRRTPSALAPAGFVFLGAWLLLAGPCLGPGDAAAAEPSHTRAYVALGAGAALTGASFLLAEAADRDYERYLVETDPARLEDRYDSARRLDRLSAGTLIAGQAALALGLYWRFLHHPRSSPARLAPAWSVAPYAGADGPGVVLDVRF